MPRRWEAPRTASQPGQLDRLEEELHAQWQRWKADRITAQEARATRNRFESPRKDLAA